MVAGLAVSCASSRGYVGRLRSLAHGKQSGDMGMFETKSIFGFVGARKLQVKATKPFFPSRVGKAVVSGGGDTERSVYRASTPPRRLHAERNDETAGSERKAAQNQKSHPEQGLL